MSKLLTIRNKIVGLFGLKTFGNQFETQRQLENFRFELGERFKLFKVFTKTEDELVFGEDDKHLNFRISLLLDHNQTEKTLAITTAVKFNNSFGRLYFLIVKPFHKFIVPQILNRVKKKLEK